MNTCSDEHQPNHRTVLSLGLSYYSSHSPEEGTEAHKACDCAGQRPHRAWNAELTLPSRRACLGQHVTFPLSLTHSLPQSKLWGNDDRLAFTEGKPNNGRFQNIILKSFLKASSPVSYESCKKNKPQEFSGLNSAEAGKNAMDGFYLGGQAAYIFLATSGVGQYPHLKNHPGP